MEEDKKSVSPEEAAAELNKRTEKVTEAEVNDTIKNESQGKGLFERVNVLKKYWDDACTAYSLLKDFATRKYTDCPWRVIAGLTASLTYVVLPIDLCPDLIPVIGFLDDAAVFGLALNLAKADLEKYRAWKAAQAN